MNVPSHPFQKIAIDIVGLLKVISIKMNQYILTVNNLYTRWPEATPFKKNNFRISSRNFVSIFFPDLVSQILFYLTEVPSLFLKPHKQC